MGTGELQTVASLPRLGVDELHLLRGLLTFPAESTLDLVRDLSAVWPWLGDAVRELDTLGLDDWRAEYRRLFFHGAAPALCPPFASAYAGGGDEPAWGMASLHMRAELPLSNLPPDYLGAELNLLAELLESEHDLGPELLQEAWRHMQGWVPAFADCLVRHAGLHLYRGIGQRLDQLFA